jgi:hypothetical protein
LDFAALPFFTMSTFFDYTFGTSRARTRAINTVAQAFEVPQAELVMNKEEEIALAGTVASWIKQREVPEPEKVVVNTKEPRSVTITFGPVIMVHFKRDDKWTWTAFSAQGLCIKCNAQLPKDFDWIFAFDRRFALFVGPDAFYPAGAMDAPEPAVYKRESIREAMVKAIDTHQTDVQLKLAHGGKVACFDGLSAPNASGFAPYRVISVMLKEVETDDERSRRKARVLAAISALEEDDEALVGLCKRLYIDTN